MFKPLAGLLATIVATLGLAAPAETATAERITVYPSQVSGVRITDWGFDLKQAEVIRRVARNYHHFAERVFGSGEITAMRIPFRADRAGVKADGHLRSSWYAETMQAIANIRAVNPRIKIMVSRSTVGTARDPDFASSLKYRGQVVPWKYGRVAAEYLTFLRRHGIIASMVGLDNEPRYNEANLTPARLRLVVKAMNAYYAWNLPKIIGNCGSEPNPDWLASVPSWQKIGYASTHTNPDRRDTQRPDLFRLVHVGRQRSIPTWNTEFHFPDHPTAPYRAMKTMFLSLFDNTDAGVSAIMWWGYKPDGSVKADVQRAIVESTFHTRHMLVKDGDGPAVTTGTLITRAFIRGGHKFLWVINDTTRAVSTTRRGTFQRWTRRPGGGIGYTAGSNPTSYPAMSITLVRWA